MAELKTQSSRKAKRHDKLARWVITLGGVAVIASVIAILVMIVSVTLPLFRNPGAERIGTYRLPSPTMPDDVLGLGIDTDVHGREGTVFVWTADGRARCVDVRSGKPLNDVLVAPPTGSEDAVLTQVEAVESNCFWLIWSDGAVALIELSIGDDASCSTHVVAELPGIKKQRPRMVSARRAESGAVTRAALLPDGRIAVTRQSASEGLFGDEELVTRESEIRDAVVGSVRSLTMDSQGDAIYVGTDDGRIARWQLDEQVEAAKREVVQAFDDRRAVTALAVALGDVSLAVGDERGDLTTWFTVRADETRKLRMVHNLGRLGGAVREIAPSRRNKSLLSLDENGLAKLEHITSERELLRISPQPRLRKIAMSDRGNSVVGLDVDGGLNVWRVEGGCPEISLKTLFGKVHYEGYDAPQYVWQTTGGADFEPKFSLVPLLFGTLKGTFYAMLFAAPLALAAAAYVSYFTTPALRGIIKPLVEIMATVPSVVIGFLIALWLAPIIEHWVLAFFLCFVTLPAALILFLSGWQLVRRREWAKRLENGYEFLAFAPVLIIGILAAVWLAKPLEDWFFDGNFRQWLFAGPLGARYDQRNNIIIAFGLGFTVIPLIFSIAEDSLSNVPYGMTAASLAVGASRWQTLWHIILPSASPGIFAAMMIGFGRAIGETMIVLMATGNTPIIDWSPFNGMRTLSANIAVEIPEAPVGGTLYRVLFLCAVLLFILTFAVNTAAEVVRQRLRKRFGQF